MTGYWNRHRLLPTLIMSVVLALITGLLFVFPCITQNAESYNAQSIYKNTDIDFIVPEPSEAQIKELPGTYGIAKLIPFYMTKTQVTVNGSSRTTTVLLSDQLQDIDITMYNPKRIIAEAASEYDNPILVDWQFCQDTGAGIGDIVSITIAGETVKYTVSSIYETNSVYDGGAIFAPITANQKAAIMQNSKNSGYSGMYVSASDYNICRAYLTTDYRPMGRLKDRSQFDSDEQYQVHYDAIMSSAYANEITDFRIRETDFDSGSSYLMIWFGAVLATAVVVAFNAILARRGCEKGYFKKHCIPKGQNVKSYYGISFVTELLLFVVAYVLSIILGAKTADTYIPASAFNKMLVIVPATVAIAEGISLIMNNSMVATIDKEVKLEQAKKKEQKTANATATDAECNPAKQ